MAERRAGHLYLLVLGFGLWLVHLEGYGLDTGWIDWALGLYFFSLLAGGLGGQRPKRARRRASRLAVLAILVLMVFKP